MKKALVLAVLVFSLSYAMAQESTTKFELGVNVGTTTYTNYPAVSVFQDASERYGNFGESLYFGMRRNKSLYGLQFRLNNFQTSAIVENEQVMQTGLALMFRRYEPMGNKLDVFFGAKAGLSMMMNDIKNKGNKPQVRWGSLMEFETGVNFNISEKRYIGVLGTVIMGNNFSKDLTLPVGTTPTDKYVFGGYSLMMQYGIRF